MRYYKIIQDNVIIDVNCTFFRYLPNHHRIIACEFKDAELIQSSDQENFYTVEWLKPIKDNVFNFPQAHAVQISEDEYNELYEKLQLGVTVPELDEVLGAAITAPIEDTGASQEQIMDLASMRKKIADLEAIIKQLLKN